MDTIGNEDTGPSQCTLQTNMVPGFDFVSVDKINRVGSGFLMPLERNGMEE